MSIWRGLRRAKRTDNMDENIEIVEKANGQIDPRETVRANSDLIESTALRGHKAARINGKDRVIKLRYPEWMESLIVRALKDAFSIETDRRYYDG